tara:strand:+ start:710 stop:892 length:183 start_codon:yes stop_codon:yes gene_type:complete
MKKFLNFSWFKDWKKIYKQDGFRVLIQKKGWTVAFFLFMFFLTKGLLWLLIPYLLAKEFF